MELRTRKYHTLGNLWSWILIWSQKFRVVYCCIVALTCYWRWTVNCQSNRGPWLPRELSIKYENTYIFWISPANFGYILGISRTHSRHILGTFWADFGQILSEIWPDFGNISWAYSRYILGIFWVYSGHIFGVISAHHGRNITRCWQYFVGIYNGYILVYSFIFWLSMCNGMFLFPSRPVCHVV